MQELYNEKPLTYNLGQLSVLMQAAQLEPQDKSSFIMNLKIKCLSRQIIHFISGQETFI
jgi:hypothetical protein